MAAKENLAAEFRRRVFDATAQEDVYVPVGAYHFLGFEFSGDMIPEIVARVKAPGDPDKEGRLYNSDGLSDLVKSASNGAESGYLYAVSCALLQKNVVFSILSASLLAPLPRGAARGVSQALTSSDTNLASYLLGRTSSNRKIVAEIAAAVVTGKKEDALDL